MFEEYLCGGWQILTGKGEESKWSVFVSIL
jgi:hypothetical protein